MTPPKPTRKQKRRYALVAFNRLDIAYVEMKDAIIRNFQSLYGTVGVSDARMLFIKFDENKLICRINTSSLNHLRAAMLISDSTGRKSVSSRIIVVSGTLKGLRAKFFKASLAP